MSVPCGCGSRIARLQSLPLSRYGRCPSRPTGLALADAVPASSTLISRIVMFLVAQIPEPSARRWRTSSVRWEDKTLKLIKSTNPPSVLTRTKKTLSLASSDCTEFTMVPKGSAAPLNSYRDANSFRLKGWRGGSWSRSLPRWTGHRILSPESGDRVRIH